MITAQEIAELRKALAKSTQGAWVVRYFAKQPRVSTTANNIVVMPHEDTLEPADAELIVAMQRNLGRLLDALEAKEAERLEAVVAMEHANNEHMATLRKMLAESAEVKANIDRAISTHNEVCTLSERQSRELASARAKLDHQAPLVAAVETWVRTRHSPRLIAAWDAYSQARAACLKSGS
jgi:low affinity Fe/Cu permease